jgi:DtxR family transcriptional regulator, Mn-dependent transcriptional regulator
VAKLKLSESQEDYLKQIYLLTAREKTVSTLRLAEKLDVKPASVTNMLKKLAVNSLIEYEPYRGASLTPSGKMVALEVIRHHRLLELFLSEVLGYGWEDVHEEAERLEHVISELFEQKIAEALGHPTHDPHGDPIPNASLELPDGPPLQPLSRMDAGTVGHIRRVTAQDKDELNMLTKLNLILSASIRVLSQERSGVRIQTSGEQYLLPLPLAAQIWVEMEMGEMRHEK